MDGQVAAGHGAVDRHVRRLAHRRDGAIADVERVGQVVGVGDVVDQEVGIAVVGRRRDLYDVDQLVDVDALDQREPRVAQAVVVLKVAE